MITVVAFHGWIPRWTPWINGAQLLERDVGGLRHSIDFFFRGNDANEAARFCKRFENVFLIGYSEGGSTIGHLTYKLNNIVGAAVYEAPLRGIPTVDRSKDFPVWSLWNRTGRRHWAEAQDTIEQWSHSRTEFHLIENLNGRGHMTWFPIGHAWDTAINPTIRQAINK